MVYGKLQHGMGEKSPVPCIHLYDKTLQLVNDSETTEVFCERNFSDNSLKSFLAFHPPTYSINRMKTPLLDTHKTECTLT